MRYYEFREVKEASQFGQELFAANLANHAKPSKTVNFVHPPSGAKGDVKHFKNYAMVTGVRTPKEGRGLGGASDVMSQINSHLDKNNLPGLLYAIPDDDEDEERLTNFYRNHGYESIKDGSSIMARKPNP